MQNIIFDSTLLQFIVNCNCFTLIVTYYTLNAHIDYIASKIVWFSLIHYSAFSAAKAM